MYQADKRDEARAPLCCHGWGWSSESSRGTRRVIRPPAPTVLQKFRAFLQPAGRPTVSQTQWHLVWCCAGCGKSPNTSPPYNIGSLLWLFQVKLTGVIFCFAFIFTLLFSLCTRQYCMQSFAPVSTEIQNLHTRAFICMPLTIKIVSHLQASEWISCFL